MVIGAGFSASLFALICPREDKSRRFFSTGSLPFIIFGIAYILTLVGGIEAAKSNVLESLKNGARDFNQQIADHIAFAMHRCSINIVNRISDYSSVSSEELAKHAKNNAMNEVTVIGADGNIIASSSEEVMKYKGTCQS